MASSTLFPTLKSPVQINQLTTLLKTIVAAGAVGSYQNKKLVDKIVELQPSFVNVGQLNPSNADEIAVYAQQAATDGLSFVSSEVKSTPRPKMEFELESGIEPPVKERRKSTRTSAYPFDKMEVGQSFFVAATEATPEPAKSLFGSVNAATRRYAIPTGQMKTGRKNGNQIPELQKTRIFNIYPVDGGARVFREQ